MKDHDYHKHVDMDPLHDRDDEKHVMSLPLLSSLGPGVVARVPGPGLGWNPGEWADLP